MRAMALGAFGVVERIGGALAPQLVAMNRWAWHGSALTTAAGIAFVALISGFFILPETRNASMPDVCDTEESGEDNARSKQRRIMMKKKKKDTKSCTKVHL